MSKHTPEPWFYHRQGFSTVYIEARIGGGMLQEIAACGPCQDGTEQQDENARRIVACVNACEGIDTKALEIVDGAARLAVDDLAGEVSMVHAAKKQRDDLLAALELMVLIHDEPSGFEGKFGKALDDAISQQKEKIDMSLANARAAIAKAKGV